MSFYKYGDKEVLYIFEPTHDELVETILFLSLDIILHDYTNNPEIPD